jgi:hypothetical protein
VSASDWQRLWHALIVVVGITLAALTYWDVGLGLSVAAAVAALAALGPLGVRAFAQRSLLDRPTEAMNRAEWAWVPIVARYAVFSAPGFYATFKLADAFDGRSAEQALSVVAALAFIEVVKVLDLDGARVDSILAGRARAFLQDNYEPQFAPGGPMPRDMPLGGGALSDVYMSVCGDQRHGGWAGRGRRERAADVQRWICDQNGPVKWR